MTERTYTHNHYVPEWYQKRFLEKTSKFYLLDLKPDTVENGAHSYVRRSILNWGPARCFAQDDLYSTFWGSTKNTEVEQFFFGDIDTRGKSALEFFSDFSIKNGMHDAFHDLVQYMSIQKLRTPKGLSAFSALLRVRDHNVLMLALQQYASLHCATWTDAVWQIVSASESPVKFLISDHPVTVYNRGAFPGSSLCKGDRDPDIRLTGTQTIFPLSSNLALLLTNLSWVRDPYQNPLKVHPNPELMRTTMFKATDIQQGRNLTEMEVLELNHITKSRARRYVAAEERDWLFPEKYLRSTHWSKYGQGYLLMPEPRCIHMGGTIYVGYEDGKSEAWNEYGHRPWQSEFENKKRFDRESNTLERFKDEFAALFGPDWRGWSHDFGNDGPKRDSPEFFEHHVRGAARRGVRTEHTQPFLKA